MVKQTRKDKNEILSVEDIPENVFEIFAVLADAAIHNDKRKYYECVLWSSWGIYFYFSL